MAVRLPLRASGQWEEYLPDPAHCVWPYGGFSRREGRKVLLLHLPPYTPELSPAEPVVPLLREAVADESFPSLEALQERLAERCVYLQEQPEVIRGVAGFGWIPEE